MYVPKFACLCLCFCVCARVYVCVCVCVYVIQFLYFSFDYILGEVLKVEFSFSTNHHVKCNRYFKNKYWGKPVFHGLKGRE